MTNKLYSSCLFLLCAGLISACGGSNPDEANKVEDTTDTSTKAEEELDDLDDSTSVKKAAKPPKPKLSTEGKHTGESVDGYVFDQQNEFLGLTKLKVSKLGVRLESPNLVCIMLPGQEAIAYNSQNGNCMVLTAKSAAMLAGKRPNESPSVEETKVTGKEKIAGLNCTHYVVTKYFIQEVPIDPTSVQAAASKKTPPKLKKEKVYGWETDIWATKDIAVPPAIVKDCARLTMMPQALGFPVRIQREVSSSKTTTSDSEASSTGSKAAAKSRTRRVIDTSGMAKTKLDKGDFALLSGFKTVKDEMQLMMSGDDSEIEGMGLEDDMEKTPAK